MRSLSALILLAVLVIFSAGPVLAQDALNDTNAMNATNDTAVADVAPVEEAAAPMTETVEAAEAIPQETASRFKQLSTFVKGATTVLGKNTAQEYMDVSQTANRDTVFTREAGASTPAVKVVITKVNTAEDKYVQVTNQAVGSWDLTGWALASAGNTTFTFPALTLEEESFVRVHEGDGVGSMTDIYTNGTAPLWIDNLVSLQDADGSIISTYDVSTAPAAGAWVDPLAKQIQY
ncbi:MAG: lamin tail domain-containing protein [Methanothrix sp.]